MEVHFCGSPLTSFFHMYLFSRRDLTQANNERVERKFRVKVGDHHKDENGHSDYKRVEKWTEKHECSCKTMVKYIKPLS